MRKALVAVLAVLGLTLGVGALAVGARTEAKTVKFSAALNIGQEVPHPKGTKAGAAGRFTATLTGTTLKWSLTFSHLTGPATASHIHKAPRGKSGPIIVSLCGPCHSPESGTVTVTNADIAAMKARQTYVNVHTTKNPGGEIRGQIGVAK